MQVAAGQPGPLTSVELGRVETEQLSLIGAQQRLARSELRQGRCSLPEQVRHAHPLGGVFTASASQHDHYWHKRQGARLVARK